LDRHEARVDVRSLLTQRALQSFLYLLETCRDPHSGKWIQDFLGCPNLLEYHGTGVAYRNLLPAGEEGGGRAAVNVVRWDEPLVRMLERPRDVVVVSAKRRGRGHGGWSKHNPYLEERWVEFEIDVDPPSLVGRVLAVREQIAQEWAASELRVLRQANGRILESYFRQSKLQRDSAPQSEGVPRVAFERTALNILNNHTAFSAASQTDSNGNGAASSTSSSFSSPFRAGNFDLLYNLCTQASIHLVLREELLLEDSYDSGGGKAGYEWLREFYATRVEEYFDGDQPYGRADDFMEELLLSSPSFLSSSPSSKSVLADPFRMAERIIETRDVVCDEWMATMEQIQADHSPIRARLLERQMAAWGESKPDASSTTQPPSDSSSESSTMPTKDGFQ